MSNKIIGSTEVIKRAKNSPSSSKSNLVNWDAIEDMPDEYSAVVTEVSFDIKNLKAAFYDIGSGVFLPRTELIAAIGEARGIEGVALSPGVPSIVEPIYEEVDWSRVTHPGGTAPPELVRIKVGMKVTKQSHVRTEDGYFRKSSACTATLNIWERCEELWAKEEKFTAGYTKKGRYDNKYQNTFDRRAHFAAEMKFAAAKAETKAHGKTVRELAGLMTGYKAEDLQDGHFTLHRIQQSSISIKADALARRQALARGLTGAPAAATAALFGSEAAALPAPEDGIEEMSEAAPPDFQLEAEPAAPAAWEILRDTIGEYLADGFIKNENEVNTVTGIVAWCDEKREAAENSEKWADAVTWLFYVEDTYIPEGKAIDHGLSRP